MMIFRKFKYWCCKKIIKAKYNNKFISSEYFHNIAELNIDYLEHLCDDIYKYHDINYFICGGIPSKENILAHEKLIGNLESYYKDTLKTMHRLFKEYNHMHRVLNYMRKHNMCNYEKERISLELDEAYKKFMPRWEKLPHEYNLDYIIKLHTVNYNLKSIEEDFN